MHYSEFYSKEYLEDSDQDYFEEDNENNSEFTDETLITNEEIWARAIISLKSESA